MKAGYPNEVKKLLGGGRREVEDAASYYLCHILLRNQTLRGLFMEFLFGNNLPDGLANEDYNPRFTGKKGGKVKPDIKLDFGNDFAVWVETKVNHVQHRTQLKTYINELRSFGDKGFLFVLTRREKDEFDLVELNFIKKTWNKLKDFFDKETLDLTSENDWRELRDFLENEGVISNTELGSIKPKTGRISANVKKGMVGAVGAFETAYRDIVFSGLDYNTGHGGPFMAIGRKRWRKIFKSEVIERLRLHCNHSQKYIRRFGEGALDYDFIIRSRELGGGDNVPNRLANEWADDFLSKSMRYKVRFTIGTYMDTPQTRKYKVLGSQIDANAKSIVVSLNDPIPLSEVEGMSELEITNQLVEIGTDIIRFIDDLSHVM